ncbi:hypothetical protein SDC9_88564 [bioreactor metagenome]|uniref:Uncharacterized protein n=1 Tax=bioreactor metagenome TaxID=1076179 RepID=A0A644ZWG0_9ZZZZ
MQGKPFDTKPHYFCETNCMMYSPEIKVQNLYANFELYMSVSELHCSHEDICKMWAEKLESGKGTGST